MKSVIDTTTIMKNVLKLQKPHCKYAV